MNVQQARPDRQMVTHGSVKMYISCIVMPIYGERTLHRISKTATLAERYSSSVIERWKRIYCGERK